MCVLELNGESGVKTEGGCIDELMFQLFERLSSRDLNCYYIF